MNDTIISGLPEGHVVITYDVLYDDYTTIEPLTFLDGIPTATLLKFLEAYRCLYNKFQMSESKNIQMVRDICHHVTKEKRIKIWQFIERQRKAHCVPTLFTYATFNMFYMLAIQNYVPFEEEENYILDNEYENIYKAIMYCNQVWTDKFSKNTNGDSQTPAEIMMQMDLPVYDINKDKIIFTQVYKGIRFFRFLEKDVRLSVCLRQFYKEHNVVSWGEYLNKILELYKLYTNKFIVNINQSELIYFNNYIINPYSQDAKTLWTDKIKGFKYLREKFLFPISKSNEYVLINNNLLLDKFYQGLVFELYQYSKDIFNKFEDYKSYIGMNFSELYLLNYLMNKIYSNSGNILISGMDFNENRIDNAPDYYMRSGDVLFLFECKDVVLNDKIKYSSDLIKLKNEIFSRICIDDYGKVKGFGQLLHVIDKIINHNMLSSLDRHIECVRQIYPIVIITDNAFMASGVNYIVKEEFNLMIRKYNIPKYIQVMDPIIISIDILFYLGLRLKTSSLNFKNILDNYIGYKNWDIFNYASFDTFIRRTYPKNFEEQIQEIQFYMHD